MLGLYNSLCHICVCADVFKVHASFTNFQDTTDLIMNSLKENGVTQQIHSVIFDIDGTLVDSNDAHAHAWVQAMAEHGHSVPFDRVRPLIGMGGDKVLPKTIGVEKESEEGKAISQRRKEIFLSHYLPNLHAFPQAGSLLEYMHARGLRLVTASSAEKDELTGLLRIIGPHAEDLFQQETSSQDAKRSKPDPDIMQVALQRTGCAPEEVVMIGDTAYDISPAAKVAIKTIAFRCGGWSDQDLAGAIAIYDGPAALLAGYNASPLGTSAGG